MKKYKRNDIVWGKVILEDVQKQQGCGERVKAKHHYFFILVFFLLDYVYICLLYSLSI